MARRNPNTQNEFPEIGRRVRARAASAKDTTGTAVYSEEDEMTVDEGGYEHTIDGLGRGIDWEYEDEGKRTNPQRQRRTTRPAEVATPEQVMRNRQEMAMEMVAQGEDVADAAYYTDLPEEEVRRLVAARSNPSKVGGARYYYVDGDGPFRCEELCAANRHSDSLCASFEGMRIGEAVTVTTGDSSFVVECRAK